LVGRILWQRQRNVSIACEGHIHGLPAPYTGVTDNLTIVEAGDFDKKP
jgi:hypothetical protein